MCLLVALAPLGCRAKHAHRDAAVAPTPAVVSVVPKLPMSEDGVAELHELDRRIEIHEGRERVGFLLQRASLRGRLEDFQRALAESAALVAASPADDTWLLRAQALAAVHEFAKAREALAHVSAPLRVDPELAIAEATGDPQALANREALAKTLPNATNLTLLAANLAVAGRYDEAIAVVPRAAAAVRDNPPELLAWLLFQWGRVYELKGELAAAREFYAAAHARVPGYVEATAHLAQTMIATGDPAGANKLVEAALVADRHPSLLELAHPDDAKREWDRYVAALPLAFSDHAARFYLGRDPAHALELARANLANRDTREARALVVEAALAARDATAACAVVQPLIDSRVRAQRFWAWRALAQCGRRADADRLAAELGIAH